MTPTPKCNSMEGGSRNRDSVIERHDSKARILSVSTRTWKFCKYKVHAAFKIKPFLALPRGSIPSQKCKVKIALQKNVKTEFYPSN